MQTPVTDSRTVHIEGIFVILIETSPETLYIINLFESSLYPPETVYRSRGQITKTHVSFFSEPSEQRQVAPL